MPREQIQYPREDRILTTGTPENPGPTVQSPGFPLLHIGWHNDPDGNGWAQAHFQVDKQFLLDILADVKPDPDGTVSVYSETLTREECNRLIKQTRRARDGAYGRDE